MPHSTAWRSLWLSASMRVKNDVRDAADLGDLLRMGRLPGAWIAPPGVRSRRELVRHRHKLVQISSSVKAQVHAVLAKCGITVGVSDLFGVAGMARLQQLVLPEVFRIRVDSHLRLLAAVESEIIAVDRLIRRELAADPGYRVIQQIPGVRPLVAAIMVAELGEVTRFAAPAQTSALGPAHARGTGNPTPPCTADRSPSRAPAGPVGCDRGGPTCPARQSDALHLRADRGSAGRHREEHRQGGRGPQAVDAGLLRATRRPDPLPAAPAFAGDRSGDGMIVWPPARARPPRGLIASTRSKY